MTLACPNAHYVCTPHTTKITQPPHHRHFIMVRYCEDSDDNFVSRTRQFNLYNTWQNSCDDNITFLSRIYHAHHAISTYRTICWDLARKGAELYTCCVQYEHNNFTPPTKQNGFIIPYDQSTLKDFCHYDINFMCKAKYEEFGEYVNSNLQHIYDAPVTQIVPFIARLYEKTTKILAAATIILTNIKTNFFKQMDKGIRCSWFETERKYTCCQSLKLSS